MLYEDDKMSDPRLHKRKKKKSIRTQSPNDNLQGKTQKKKLKEDHVRTLKSTEKYIFVAIAIICIAGISITYGVNQYLTNLNNNQNSSNNSNNTTTQYTNDLIVTTINGVSYNLSQFQGKIVVLCFVFLNNYPGPCNTTLDALNNQSVAGLPGGSYANQQKIFAIDEGDNISTINGFIDYQKEINTQGLFTIDFCQDPSHNLWTHFGFANSAAYPITVVLDKNGNVNSTFNGIVTRVQIANLIQALWAA